MLCKSNVSEMNFDKMKPIVVTKSPFSVTGEVTDCTAATSRCIADISRETIPNEPSELNTFCQ